VGDFLGGGEVGLALAQGIFGAFAPGASAARPR